MLKRGIFLFLAILAGCSNPPASKDINTRTASRVKSKTSTVKTTSNLWTFSSFAPKEGEAEGTKFIRFISEGNFSDSINNKNYLYADLIVNKANAGIFLHERKKSSPADKFRGPVQIKMTNSLGEELQMNSTKSWNKTGGILIERNNNDYSRFRIFLLQSKGTVSVEIKDSGNKIYQFNINADGFSDSFTKL